MKNKLWLIFSFAPIFALMALAYAVPLISNLGQSLQNRQGEWVGLDNYITVYTSYYFIDSLLYTLKIALISTALAMIIAVLVALALRQTFVGKKLVVFMFQFNLTIPRMAAAMVVTMLLSQTGFISQIAYSLGFIERATEFLWLVYDSQGVGVIIAFTWKFFPYIGMSALSILQGASLEYENQAATLGVGKFRRFFHVTLPLVIPAVSIASIIVFASAFGDYELPMILGNSSNHVLSVFTYLKYCDSTMSDPPQAYVLMITMSIILTAVILVYRKLTMVRS